MTNKVYAIGQKINAIDPCHPNATSGGKMTDGYIGADRKIHFRSGNAVPLPQDAEISGYDLSGISHFVWLQIRNNTPVNEDLLRQYGENEEIIKDAIAISLLKLGFDK